MNAQTIKQIAVIQGADVCGVAPLERFHQAPKGYHPSDIYSECRSVISFGIRMPRETLNAESTIPYEHYEQFTVHEADRIAYRIAIKLQDMKIGAVPLPSDDPCVYWDPEKKEARGVLSMKHTAYLAGLGYLGKNTLMINPQYGNILTLGAILINLSLEGDPVNENSCPENCELCLKNCPGSALTGQTIIQKSCRTFSIRQDKRDTAFKKCYRCRSICPRRFGYEAE